MTYSPIEKRNETKVQGVVGPVSDVDLRTGFFVTHRTGTDVHGTRLQRYTTLETSFVLKSSTPHSLSTQKERSRLSRSLDPFTVHHSKGSKKEE